MPESADKADKSAEKAHKGTEKADNSAERAYAAAAEARPTVASPKPASAPVQTAPAAAAKAAVDQPAAPVKSTSPAKAPAKVAAAKAPRKKARRAAPKAKPAPAANTKPLPSITQLKEQIMATAKTTDYTKPFADAVSEMQSKVKAAYDKSTVYAGEMTDFAKGNVEAVVESGKILSAGMQTMGKKLVDEAKSAYETATADVKEMASVKSPTELFQLQGKLARRNFDTFVAFSSKAGDDMMKLYADAFAPISGRVSLAAEKLSKAA